MAWDEIGRSYDAVADVYEARFEAELADKPFDRQLLDRFAAAVADPVVEVGCGPGQIGAHLRRRGRTVLGLDLSPEMAKRAATRLDAAVTADLRRLPLPSRAVGGLAAFYSVIHLPRTELRPGMAELARVLRPAGRLLVSAHEGTDQLELDEFLGEPVPMVVTLFTLDELVAAATAAGLDVLEAQRRDPYPSEHPTVRLYLEARRP
jgi:SAM-dependent methyltransferase